MKFHFLQHGSIGFTLRALLFIRVLDEFHLLEIFRRARALSGFQTTLLSLREHKQTLFDKRVDRKKKKKTCQVTKQCDLLRTWSIRVCHCLQFDHNHLILMFWFVFMYSLHSVPFPLQVTSALGLFCFQHVTA